MCFTHITAAVLSLAVCYRITIDFGTYVCFVTCWLNFLLVLQEAKETKKDKKKKKKKKGEMECVIGVAKWKGERKIFTLEAENALVIVHQNLDEKW